MTPSMSETSAPSASASVWKDPIETVPQVQHHVAAAKTGDAHHSTPMTTTTSKSHNGKGRTPQRPPKASTGQLPRIATPIPPPTIGRLTSQRRTLLPPASAWLDPEVHNMEYADLCPRSLQGNLCRRSARKGRACSMLRAYVRHIPSLFFGVDTKAPHQSTGMKREISRPCTRLFAQHVARGSVVRWIS